MNKVIDTFPKIRHNYIMKTIKTVLSYFPSKLPTGVTAFHAYADEVIELTGPIADVDSLKWAIANQIIHLPPQTSYKPKQYFVRSLMKAAANQIASSVFQDIKLKQQKAAQEAAALAEQQAKADKDVEILPD